MTARIFIVSCFLTGVLCKEKAKLEVQVEEYGDVKARHDIFGQFSLAGMKLNTEGNLVTVRKRKNNPFETDFVRNMTPLGHVLWPCNALKNGIPKIWNFSTQIEACSKRSLLQNGTKILDRRAVEIILLLLFVLRWILSGIYTKVSSELVWALWSLKNLVLALRDVKNH